DTAVARWAASFSALAGASGQLLVDIVPELELLIGPQPPAPEASPAEAEHRFFVLFQRFIGILGSASRPLVLFLDDLHWIDLPSLRVLEFIARSGDTEHTL